MSFPDGQPRPDETSSDQDFPQIPGQPQPPLDTGAIESAETLSEAVLPTEAGTVVGADIPAEPAGETPVGAQDLPYAVPHGSGPFAAPQDMASQQPYSSPYSSPTQEEAPSDPTVAPPLPPYGAPQAQPYGSPQTQPYGTPQSQGYGVPQSQGYGAPQGQPYGASQAQQPYGAPYGAMPASPTKPLSVMGIIGLVVGILGLLISWIPFLNFLAYFFALPALILGIIAIVKSGANGATRGRGFGIAAMILAVLTLLITISTQIFYASLFDRYSADIQKELERIEQLENPEIPLPGIDEPSPTFGGEEAQIFEGEGDVAEGDYHVKLISAVKAGQDFEGKPTVVVTYDLTNKQANEDATPFGTYVQAFQNGRELEIAFFGLEEPEGYDSSSYLAEIKPGATQTVTLAYILLDETSPVSVEASGFFSDTKVVKEFPIQ